MDSLNIIDNDNIQAQLGKLYTASSEYRQSENYRRLLALCTNFKIYSMFNVSFGLPTDVWIESLQRLIIL